MTREQAIRVCREYLKESTAAGKEALSGKLRSYKGAIPPIIDELRPGKATAPSAKGLTGKVSFETPGLAETYVDDHLYYHVPDGYDPGRRTGLIIYLHGGGPGTKRTYAGETIDASMKYANGIAFLLEETDYITVAPSAPWNETSCNRWALPETEKYLAAVVTESMSRFSIDPDRVVLGGTSMGGMGGMALIVRIPDRFAAVYAGSVSWEKAYWKAATGTPLFLIHGANDAIAPGHPKWSLRPKFTDVFFAREADRLLTKYGVEHIYAEHDGGHPSGQAKPQIKRFLGWMQKRTRDPYAAHVFAVSHGDAIVYQPHNRWVSVEQLDEGKLEYDGCVLKDMRGGWKQTLEQFNKAHVVARKSKHSAGYVEARNLGGNRFSLETRNVKTLSLWFHPRMADLNKPIQLTIDGKAQSIEVKPSLTDALRSFERRHDWGLIYHACAVVEIPAE